MNQKPAASALFLRRLFAGLMAAVALAVLPGCIAVAAGAGAGAGVVAYVRGDLETTVPTE